jgi:CheY-like chemotaxis protein/MinD-like ATPase involved in chromosome partitioning or flagellar assembly
MATILVIDDDLDLQQMLRLMLQRGGYKVITTGDGPDGLTKAKTLKPDMAIVDVMMPGMNGYQVVRKMREDPELSGMVILILTARAQPVDREAAIAAQADDYMPKPFAPNELLAKVSELMENRGTAQGPARKTIGVFSLRGGVGVTSVAVNLALAFQARGLPTCLIDLKSGPGHVALQLRLNAKITWVDWANGNEATIDSILKALTKHDSGLEVMAAPITPAADVPPLDRVTTILTALQGKFARVVIDLPGAWDPIVQVAIGSADTLWLVLAPEVGSLQSTVGALRALKAIKIPDEKIELIANQNMPRPGLALPAIEKALGHGFKGKLPYDENQGAALGQGAPLLLSQPESPLAAAIKALV